MTQVKQVKRSPLKVVATIVAVIVVILYIAAATQIREYSEGRPIEYDARDYIYPAESGRYGDLYDTAIRDMGKNAQYTAEVEEYRALAFYYEQAVLEHAYRETGDDQKADEFARRMDEYAEQLGSMSSRAESVREAVAPSGV